MQNDDDGRRNLNLEESLIFHSFDVKKNFIHFQR